MPTTDHESPLIHEQPAPEADPARPDRVAPEPPISPPPLVRRSHALQDGDIEDDAADELALRDADRS